MRLRAGGETRAVDAEVGAGPLPQATGRFSARETFAATLAEADEPIAVALGAGPSFRMPASAELREVVADCRA
jgi:hypothetical protein